MSLLTAILLVLLTALLLFVLFRVFYRQLPVVHVNPHGHAAPVVARMSSLHTPYFSTPWLPDGHTQTIWGMRFRRSRPDCRREIFTFADDGRCALDFFDPAPSDGPPPVLMVFHTLGGGTREPCSSNLAYLASRAGYRAFVCNMRGHSGVPFTSRRLYHPASLDDTQAVIAYVRERYNPPFFFIAGFSFGAYVAVAYGIADGAVDGIAVVSHTCDPTAANRMLVRFIQRRLYTSFMVQKLISLLKKNKFLNYPDGLTSKTVEDFDKRVACPEWNIPDLETYYAPGILKKTIPVLKTVTLALTADNDPMIDNSCTPREEAEKCENAAYVRVRNGGHVSFPVGWRAEKSFMDTVILDFFNTIMQLKSK
jgi:predicted alpha/beta-fold hydrolase